ncbi:MAG: DEAD/DEAH box helicase, partial [Myxococcota bacterium]
LEVVERLDPERFRLEIDGTLPRVARASSADLSIDVTPTGRNWFGLDGTAETPLGKLALDQLVRAVEDGEGWVTVGKNAYVRIDKSLQQQLAALASPTPDDGPLSLLAVHAPLLQELEASGATVSGSAEWRSLVDAIEAAAELRAEVPDGLRAELRPYQLEGFRWLASLAEWSPGAVLADDMGLGKTVQTLALLARRAHRGPALVVAPTSVVFNWRAELERFAPGLSVRTYAGAGRAAALEELGPSTVVLASYGILQRDADELAGVSWATTVLDEAQAVKTPTSQRSRSAVRLDSAFRVALSGTPVENRAEELWSVFAATVPGLLGPLRAFSERYGTADATARQALARLVSPFVLRRTKQVVATDLPERTELVDTVELSEEHRAIYERARRQALVAIEQAPPRERRLRLLAQLTRLRQLACDPRLVDAASPLTGAKVEVAARRLHTVRESGSRSLVFSNFVGHLELLRQRLESDGFRIAWLTGATPADARPREVARFQSGDADAFLISLKAGGTGLNLTAASYVFHLDPWWNPAAEDQATDRAHRIGQTEPVTVYRIIAARTIEQQILALHDEKRELVETLLAGSGSARPVEPEELMALLADPSSAPLALPDPPPSAPSDGSETLDAWLDQATLRLARHALKPRTQRAYHRSLEQLVAWSQVHEPDADVELATAAYLRAVERGELPRSRRTMLSAALAKVSYGVT